MIWPRWVWSVCFELVLDEDDAVVLRGCGRGCRRRRLPTGTSVPVSSSGLPTASAMWSMFCGEPGSEAARLVLPGVAEGDVAQAVEADVGHAADVLVEGAAIRRSSSSPMVKGSRISARERAGGGEQRRQRGQVRQPLAATLPGRRAGRGRGASRAPARRRRGRPPTRGSRSRVARPRPRRRPRPCRSRPPRRRSGAAWRAAKSAATRSAIRRSRPRRPRSGVSARGIAQASGLAGRIRPPAGPRPADPVGVGRPVDLARRGEPGRVGRPQLERVEAVGGLVGALARPLLDRVRGRVEELVEPLLLVGREACQDVVDGASDPARRSRPAAG